MEQSIKELLLALYNNREEKNNELDNLISIQCLTDSPKYMWQPIADKAAEEGYIIYPGNETTYSKATISVKGIAYLKKEGLI